MRGDKSDLFDTKAAGLATDIEYWVLEIEVRSDATAWVAACLVKLGFSAFEERTSAHGTLLLVYADAERRLCELASALRARAREAVQAPELSCAISRLGSDWQLAWTRHLTPVQLTPRLRLIPRAPAGSPLPSELYLEPAFAFGFGEHPTTRLLATWLESVCQGQPCAKVLDVGSGTGVLALVAERNGASRVVGVDTSAFAVRAARVNAELNCAKRVEFVQGSVADVEGTFDVVVCNIEAGVLASLAPLVVARLAPGARLALTGLVEDQVDEVAQSYADAGVDLTVADRDAEWCLLAARGRSGCP